MELFLCNHKRARKARQCILVLLFLLFPLILPLFGCSKTVDYLDCVSELRDNVFLAETDDFSLRIYAVKKEHPYVSDGIPQASTSRIEAYLVAPNGTKTCHFSFTANGERYQGEMSFDNVKCEYYYSRTLDVSKLKTIDCEIVYDEKTIALTAKSVKDEKTLSHTQILKQLYDAERELFETMTDAYGFTGEIYVRLLYEDAPYYYVGVMERTGTVHAFLINAQSGKVIAKRNLS